jgi:hypothetical protein
MREHLGLKILGILSVIGGLLALVGGLYYSTIGAALMSEGEDSIVGIIALIPVGASVIAMGAIMIVAGAIVAIIGWKLYQHKKWAYWVYFVLTILGFLGSLVSLSIFGIIVGAIVIWYLYKIREDFMQSRSKDYQISWS